MENKKSMWSYAATAGLIFGLASVVLTIVFYIISPPDAENLKGGNSWIQSILSILMTMLVLIYATRNYRDEALGGYISYGKSLGFALAIALPAMFIIAAYTIIHSKFIDPGLMERVGELQADKMAEQGMSDEQIEQSMKVMHIMSNPFITALFVMLGTFFQVLICGLITSIFTKKEPAIAE